MTVKELINELSKHNPDAEVLVFNDEYDGEMSISGLHTYTNSPEITINIEERDEF